MKISQLYPNSFISKNPYNDYIKSVVFCYIFYAGTLDYGHGRFINFLNPQNHKKYAIILERGGFK